MGSGDEAMGRHGADILDLKESVCCQRGGAVFLGVNGVICKAHGSSKAPAIKASLFQAETAVKHDIKSEITARLTDEKLSLIKYE
jgi:fatty acid/phospholipid biosynthesis enzyme